ncbi:serine hydrolase [Devosia ginsengisoli]|uniref:serine hydrolase domain-containing protein n=1 Tax=Devosia ginsengisoli TaxID=400770 RepID=UPI0026F06E39|nr:serine hydrolase [Devosia ginsengisoli]MCR6672801.1 beta-lactamase family protein [Devosia ginsengisoli]
MDWMRSEPASQGFSPDIAEKLDAMVSGGTLGAIHAIAVCRHGRLVLERYFTGNDQQIAVGDLGPITFTGERLHDLRSVTKSTVGLLYGIALDRGLVPGLDAPIIDSFPEYPDLVADPARRRLTVAHALDMTLGLEWDESLPYTDPRNSEIAMEFAPDRYRFTLDRPIVAAPGERWIYSGGAVALLGALIERGSGQRLTAFAKENLFAPLGITSFEWFAGMDGNYSAAAGLRLGALDLLRIGAMLADGGRYDGRAVVPSAWLAQSWTPRATTSWGQAYGYLWYLDTPAPPAFPDGTPGIAGFGNGGQRLFVLPEAGLACVVLAGLYDTPGAEEGPQRLWEQLVLPNLNL